MALTKRQQEAIRFIVQAVESGHIPESFEVNWGYYDGTVSVEGNSFEFGSPWQSACSQAVIRALEANDMLHVEKSVGGPGVVNESIVMCTLTGEAYEAVRKNFQEPEPLPTTSILSSAPVEIVASLSRFRAKFPTATRTGFLIMRFATKKPYGKIVEALKKICHDHGLVLVRADDHEFHADLWPNVQTYLHGCGFGIAVYERIDTDEPNANVGLEVGYMLAMGKPVLLLRDQSLKTLQADLVGKLYKPFDTHDPEESLPGQVKKWLSDYGFIVGT
jgi:hypothetical protein